MTDSQGLRPLLDFVSFSDRYGLRSEERGWGREHWTARHADHGIVSFGCCPPDPKRVCACPGSSGKRQCCEVATAEDLLCDACREHCWAIDDSKTYHRLIDVYGTPNERTIQP